LEDLDRCISKDLIKVYTERLERHLSRSSKTDWKDTYHDLPREIGKTLSKSTQNDWKDPYQGLPRQIGKTQCLSV
jgi:hypothetical protein